MEQECPTGEQDLGSAFDWGPCASQAMPGSHRGCSAPLFLSTPWGHPYPKGTGMGIHSGFQPPLGWWWVAGSCQTLEVLPGFHFGGADSHLHSLECAAVCLSLLISSGCPAKALFCPHANSTPPMLSPLSVPLSPALVRGW